MSLEVVLKREERKGMVGIDRRRVVLRMEGREI